MQITYLLPAIGHCGGQKIIAEHVTRLTRVYGHDARVFTLGGSFADWFHYPVPCQRFSSRATLHSALIDRGGAIVATTPETVQWALDDKAQRNADQLPARHYYFVQDEDEATYLGNEHGKTYEAGLFHIYEGVYVEKHIQRKYNVKGYNIGIGYDPYMYSHQPWRKRDMYRIFTPFRSDDGGPGDLKGFDITCETLNVLLDIAPDTIAKKIGVVTYGKSNKFDSRYNMKWAFHFPHIHMHNASDLDIARTMNESGVFLHTSRHEGFGLPLLESMACGLPIVCTDSHGNREHCKAFMLMGPTPENLAKTIVRDLMHNTYWTGKQFTGLKIAKKYEWGRPFDPIHRLHALFEAHARGGNVDNE
jgi:glycosyltransferase involved in cell wall biosynthesis